MAAAVLFLAAGLGVVRLATTFPELDLDGSTAGSKAATRMRAVVATGDLSAAPGGTLETSVRCGGDDSSGEPLLQFVATAPPGPKPVSTTMDARLTAAGWVRDRDTTFNAYSKQFGFWTAHLNVLPAAVVADGFRGSLAVQTELGADCVTLRKEVRSIARIPSGPLPANQW